MLTASPATGSHLLRPKTGRRPLQIINAPANPITSTKLKPNVKLGWIEIFEDSDNEKSNPGQNQNCSSSCSPVCVGDDAQAKIEPFDASLAEELNAIREKMERLRIDREKTETMLKERELMMELKMKELEQRGEVQKELEMEVDRLYRLNELRSLCNRILPIRSMREKEKEKIKQDKPQEGRPENVEEIKEESFGTKEK